MVIVTTHAIAAFLFYNRNPERFLTEENKQQVAVKQISPTRAQETNNGLKDFSLSLLRCGDIQSLGSTVKSHLCKAYGLHGGGLFYYEDESNQVFTADSYGIHVCSPIPECIRNVYKNRKVVISSEGSVPACIVEHLPGKSVSKVGYYPVCREEDGSVLAALVVVGDDVNETTANSLNNVIQQIAACYNHIQRTFHSTRPVEEKVSQSLIRLCGELYDQDAGQLQLKVLSYLEEQTQAEYAFLLLVVPESQELFCQVIGQKILQEEWSLAGNSDFSVAIETKQPISLEDIPVESKKVIEEQIGCPLRSFLCVPVTSRSDNNLIALTCLANKQNANRFTDRDISCIRQCFRYTATVLTSTLAFQNERKLKIQTQALLQVARDLFTNLGEFMKIHSDGIDTFPMKEASDCWFDVSSHLYDHFMLRFHPSLTNSLAKTGSIGEKFFTEHRNVNSLQQGLLTSSIGAENTIIEPRTPAGFRIDRLEHDVSQILSDISYLVSDLNSNTLFESFGETQNNDGVTNEFDPISQKHVHENKRRQYTNLLDWTFNESELNSIRAVDFSNIRESCIEKCKKCETAFESLASSLSEVKSVIRESTPIRIGENRWSTESIFGESLNNLEDLLKATDDDDDEVFATGESSNVSSWDFSSTPNTEVSVSLELSQSSNEHDAQESVEYDQSYEQEKENQSPQHEQPTISLASDRNLDDELLQEDNNGLETASQSDDISKSVLDGLDVPGTAGESVSEISFLTADGDEEVNGDNQSDKIVPPGSLDVPGAGGSVSEISFLTADGDERLQEVDNDIQSDNTAPTAIGGTLDVPGAGGSVSDVSFITADSDSDGSSKCTTDFFNCSQSIDSEDLEMPSDITVLISSSPDAFGFAGEIDEHGESLDTSESNPAVCSNETIQTVESTGDLVDESEEIYHICSDETLPTVGYSKSKLDEAFVEALTSDSQNDLQFQLEDVVSSAKIPEIIISDFDEENKDEPKGKADIPKESNDLSGTTDESMTVADDIEGTVSDGIKKNNEESVKEETTKENAAVQTPYLSNVQENKTEFALNDSDRPIVNQKMDVVKHKSEGAINGANSEVIHVVEERSDSAPALNSDIFHPVTSGGDIEKTEDTQTLNIGSHRIGKASDNNLLGEINAFQQKLLISSMNLAVDARASVDTMKDSDGETGQADSAGGEYPDVLVTVSDAGIDNMQVPLMPLGTIDINDLTKLLREIMQQARNLTNAERCSVFLIDPDTDELVAKVFDGITTKKDNEPGESWKRLNVQEEIRMPITQGIAGLVATSGELLNIKDAYAHPLFYRGIDDSTGFRTRNILCFPIKNEKGTVLGVAQLCNKKNAAYFTTFDEEIATAFGIYCCISISHSLMYKKLLESQHRKSLANELMIFHMQVSPDDVTGLSQVDIPHPRMLHPDFLQFSYAPRSLPEDSTLLGCLSMFEDLNLISRWRIRREALARFVLMVKKGYRNPPYHNWMHAYTVAQFCYQLIKNLKLEDSLDDIEMFALFVSCLCHDIDHRGTNNSFQNASKSVLAALYSSEGSVLERHHFAQTMCILNTEGCNVFEHLSSKEYQQVLDLMRDIILATDLAHHFKILKTLREMADRGYDRNNMRDRKNLLYLLMTSCDLSDQTRPWDNTKKVAALIYKEFFSQGDMEKAKGLEPGDMYDRERAQIPTLQIGFLDHVALPVYNLLGKVFPTATEVADRVTENKGHWEKISNLIKERKGGDQVRMTFEEVLAIENEADDETVETNTKLPNGTG